MISICVNISVNVMNLLNFLARKQQISSFQGSLMLILAGDTLPTFKNMHKTNFSKTFIGVNIYFSRVV